YGELASQVEQVARALARLRLPAESVVGVCLERTPRLVVALPGGAPRGRAHLPLDPSHPAERRRFMLEDSGAAALIGDGAGGGDGGGGGAAPPAGRGPRL